MIGPGILPPAVEDVIRGQQPSERRLAAHDGGGQVGLLGVRLEPVMLLRVGRGGQIKPVRLADSGGVLQALKAPLKDALIGILMAVDRPEIGAFAVAAPIQREGAAIALGVALGELRIALSRIRLSSGLMPAGLAPSPGVVVRRYPHWP